MIENVLRFAFHGLKHRGINNNEDQSAGVRVTDAMRQLYDHPVPAVIVAVRPKRKG